MDYWGEVEMEWRWIEVCGLLGEGGQKAVAGEEELVVAEEEEVVVDHTTAGGKVKSEVLRGKSRRSATVRGVTSLRMLCG